MKLNRIALSLALFLAAVAVFAQREATSQPDFAFPDKVCAQALAEMRHAQADGNGPEMVGATVRYSLARAAVSTDSLPAVLSFITSTANAIPDEPAVHSLLSLLKADIYTQIYRQNAAVYNRRGPLGELPQDYSEWGRQEFLSRVRSLVNSAVADTAALLDTPTALYAPALQATDEALRVYPNLLAMVAKRSIDCLEAFSGARGALNPALLQCPDDTALWPTDTAQPAADILRCYALIDAATGPDTQGRADNTINRLRYISSNIFTDDFSQTYMRLNPMFMELAEKNWQSPFAANYLLAVEGIVPGDPLCKDYYSQLQAYAASHPDCRQTEALKQRLDYLATPQIDLLLPSNASPAHPFPIVVSGQNTNSLKILVYDVSVLTSGEFNPTFAGERLKGGRRLSPCDTITANFAGRAPFALTDTLTYSLPSFGRYIFMPVVEGSATPDRSPIVSCSALLGGSISASDKTMAFVVDPVTGQPQSDVALRFRPWTNRREPSLLPGHTDNNGAVTLNLTESGALRPERGADKWAAAWNAYPANEPREQAWQLSAQVNTSLSLYRPGDEAQFAVVVFETRNSGETRLAANRRLKAVARNANWQPFDTLSLATDTFGRAEGAFALPADGLTGRFSIAVYDEAMKRSVGSGSFEVSDYKLPTFFVEVDTITPPATLGDKATVGGVATTFAGFPVEDGTVRATLSVRASVRPWSPVSPQFATVEATTGSDGRFTLTIPAEVIDASPCPKGMFLLDIAVTSASGETQTATARFNMGHPLALSANIPDAVNAEEKPTATVAALNAQGEAVDVELRYKIAGKETFEGTVNSKEVGKLIAGLPLGAYRAWFATANPAMADTLADIRFAVYRPTGDFCPVDQALWLPSTEIVADPQGKAQMVFGSNRDGANVMVVATDRQGRWMWFKRLATRRGMQSLTVDLPSGMEVMGLNLRCVSDFQTYSYSVAIKDPSSLRALHLETETFRDRVNPGAEEKLTLRVSPSNAEAAAPVNLRSALMLDMSNKAIDVLAPNPLSLSFPKIWVRPVYGQGFQTLHNAVATLADPDLANGSLPWVEAPALNMYGRSFFPMMNFAYGAMRKLSVSAKNAPVAMSMASDMAVIEEAADGGAAVGLVDTDSAQATAEVGSQSEAREVVYRPSEIPLAFFRPMLATDSVGRLEISYTVPNANTTWLLRALAYNDQLLTATTEAQIVATKPVMVSLNAPRFLRNADRLALPCLVMNNTDETQAVTALLQILDPSTGAVLKEQAFAIDSLSAKGSRSVAIEFVADTSLPAVEFRAKATIGQFTDGEQTLIPLLPSTQCVVESQMFYIAPSQAHFALDVEARQPGSRTLLNFTENPAWEVVSALPGLREGPTVSSLSAASALFSACVAEGLMRQYPETARALRRWQANPQDSMLVSNLQKNQELKQMLLSATPWVAEGLSQTQRLQRLALLLDSRETRKAVNAAIENLRKTSASGGGWAWTPFYPEYSEWSTLQVLRQLGTLKSLGWLPSDGKLNEMIESSLRRLDSSVAADFAKHPKADFTAYAFTRSLFANVRQSSASARVSAAAVQRAVARWKEASVTAKAVDALLLNRSGYRATALQILESLRQYATQTPEKGMWWQQLDYSTFWNFDRIGQTALILQAFAETQPSAPDIDRIRQWLVLQKANTDWGSSANTSAVVAALLTSGSRWTVNPQGTAVRLGSTLLEPQSQFETGSFTLNVSPLVEQSTVLTIDRQADYPSYGALVTLRHAPMEGLKAVKCKEASIEKEYQVFVNGHWQRAETFGLGDRVRVQLTVKTDTDLDFVTIADQRPSGFEPADQLPGWVGAGRTTLYRENRDNATNLFCSWLRRGTTIIHYDLFASQAGSFSAGAAQLTSAYNPLVDAHSAGASLQIVSR